MKFVPLAAPLAGLALIVAACAPAAKKTEAPAPAPVNVLVNDAKAMMSDLVVAPESADAFTIRCNTALDLVKAATRPQAPPILPSSIRWSMSASRSVSAKLPLSPRPIPTRRFAKSATLASSAHPTC